MSWKVEYLPEAEKDLKGLDGSQRNLVLKAIKKVQQNPLPVDEQGYGKPLGNHNSTNLAGLLKIKLRSAGLRIVYTPKHGYAVMQFVEEKTGGRLSLGAGTLYGALNSLQDKKWIEPYGDSEGRKKEYHITAQGKEIAEKELARLNELVSIASEIIGGAV